MDIHELKLELAWTKFRNFIFDIKLEKQKIIQTMINDEEIMNEAESIVEEMKKDVQEKTEMDRTNNSELNVPNNKYTVRPKIITSQVIFFKKKMEINLVGNGFLDLFCWIVWQEICGSRECLSTLEKNSSQGKKKKNSFS